MKLWNTGLVIGLAVIVITCREGINESIVEEKIIRTGQVTDALYFSNLVRSDSIIIDNNHEDARVIDLNNDGIPEFEIVFQEDTVSIKHSNQELIYFHIKSLFLRKLRENIFVSVESINYTGYVGVIQGNSILSFESQIWNPLDSIKILIHWENNLQFDFSYDFGLWNNRSSKYFAVNFQHNGRTIIAWIELSVVEYDNYILHNYASFILE